ncbi:MAG: dnaE [Nitrospira sp.]|jgi:error-prone DNA polymerase|nr:dnaE [Nitrospira sp.]
MVPDATFFPDIYRRYCHRLGTSQAYVVTGVVEAHFDTVTVTVNPLQPLSSPETADADAPLEPDAEDPYTDPHGAL